MKKPSIENNKYKTAVESLAKIINNQKKKQKHYFIRPFRKANIKLKELKKMGYKISSNLWHSCLSDLKERNVGGRKPLNVQIYERLNRFLEEESKTTSYRMIQLKNKRSKKEEEIRRKIQRKQRKLNLPKIVPNKNSLTKPVRFLNESIKETYCMFKKKTGLKISLSTLKKYKSKIYKKLHRDSDICEFCSNRNLIKIKIKNKASQLECTQDLENSEKLLIHYNSQVEKLKICINDGVQLDKSCCNLTILSLDEYLIKFDELIGLIKHKLRLDFHRDTSVRQRKSYNLLRKDTNFLKNNLLIDFDYKQQLPIGLGPYSNSFYKQRTISYLSFGVYYFEKTEIKCINYDILSDNTHQDGNAVIRALRFIRGLESFKKIDKKQYTMFADCGSHFRNKELVYYAFNELAELSILVSLNFFGPKHGKSLRDQHFSKVGFLLRQITMSYTTIEQVCEFINRKYAKSNEINSSTRYQTFAYKLNPKPYEDVVIQERIIEGLKEYFNLQNIAQENELNNMKLFSSVFSDLKVDPIKLTGVVPVDSVYRRYTRRLDFGIPIIKTVEFPLEDDKKLEEWEGREMRMKKRLEICLNSNGNLITQPGLSFDNPPRNSNAELKILHEKIKPIYCYDHCLSCNQKLEFSIDEIVKKSYTHQTDILKELANHGHKKSLKMPKLKRSRNLAEARLELIDHIKTYHGPIYSKNETDNNDLPQPQLNDEIFVKLPGMINIRVTCFFSSVFQALNSIPVLVNYFLKFESGNIIDQKYTNFLVSFSKLINKSSSKNESLNPRDFLIAFQEIYPRFKPQPLLNIFSDQQDAHEILILLIDSFANSLICKKNTNTEFAQLFKLFQGCMTSSIQGFCGHKSNDGKNEFIDLQIEIPNNLSKIHLKDCMKLFLKAEVLNEDNMWYCPHCRMKVDAFKKISIVNFPSILIISLKRFKQKFPSNHISSEINIQAPILIEKNSNYVDFEINDFDLNEFSDQKSVKYKLLATINHLGETVYNGHYVAVCRNIRNNKWFEYDDHNVKIIEQIKSCNVYVLIYSNI